MKWKEERFGDPPPFRRPVSGKVHDIMQFRKFLFVCFFVCLFLWTPSEKFEWNLDQVKDRWSEKKNVLATHHPSEGQYQVKLLNHEV